MNVSSAMTTTVKTCTSEDSLDRAAKIMWDNDCSLVAVTDGDGRVVGIVTDRDVCMAAYTQGRPLRQITVSVAMAKSVYSVREDDPISAAESLMQYVHVHRLPVVDADLKLKGMLSLHDLRRAHAKSASGQR